MSDDSININVNRSELLILIDYIYKLYSFSIFDVFCINYPEQLEEYRRIIDCFDYASDLTDPTDSEIFYIYLRGYFSLEDLCDFYKKSCEYKENYIIEERNKKEVLRLEKENEMNECIKNNPFDEMDKEKSVADFQKIFNNPEE